MTKKTKNAKETRKQIGYTLIVSFDKANCLTIEFLTYCQYEKAVSMVTRCYGFKESSTSSNYKFSKKADFDNFLKSISELL